MLLALAMLLASDWTLYDQTDNLTGERTISAIVLAENYDDTSPTLFLHCYKHGGPRFDLFVSDTGRPSYLPRRDAFGAGRKPVYIRFAGLDEARQPAPMFWRAEGMSLIDDASDMGALIAGAAASPVMEISVLTDSGKLSGRFATDGLKKAYDYMTTHCALVSKPAE